MRRIIGLFAMVSVSFGCSQPTPSASTDSTDPTPVFYDLFTVGDDTTDQGSTRNGSHSSLVGMDGGSTSVEDNDFADNVASLALRAGAKLYMAFGQCYSGGFIDELAPLGGTQSINSSARHSETASYGYEPPGGVDIDYTDAYIRALGDGFVRAEEVTRQLAALDPFGPNPDAARINEPMGSEHTQYFATGGGAELKPAAHAATGIAVLWAGMPNERDGTQMNLMIERLVAWGFARDRIWLMYGGGEAVADHPVVKAHIIGKATPVHLLAATRENLVELFNSQFGATRQKAAPDFVFFYVGDHGGLDGRAEAKLNFGKADMLVTPELKPAPGIQLYGEGI